MGDSNKCWVVGCDNPQFTGPHGERELCRPCYEGAQVRAGLDVKSAYDRGVQLERARIVALLQERKSWWKADVTKRSDGAVEALTDAIRRVQGVGDV